MATFIASPSWGALPAIGYNLNVQIVQVRDDAGGNATPLEPVGGTADAYLYESQVNEIWAQAGIQVTFLPTETWDNTEAQRLLGTERNAIYADTFTSASGDPLPAIPTDAVQIFFVLDHGSVMPPGGGTGYTGPGTGWVDNPLPAPPPFTARNAGNAQLFIDGTFGSNGRSVMANDGTFVSDSLSGTLTHEIGHLIGLRHVDDVNAGAAMADTVQDPDYSTVAATTPNLMWGAGSGPGYDGALDDDPMLSVLQENFALNADQVAAAIHNGLALDPDGNGTGVLQAIPEPSSSAMLVLGVLIGCVVRRR